MSLAIGAAPHILPPLIAFTTLVAPGFGAAVAASANPLMRAVKHRFTAA